MNPDTLFSIPAARGLAELIEETLTAIFPKGPWAKLTPAWCFVLGLGFAFLIAGPSVAWQSTTEFGIVDGLAAASLWGLGALVSGGKTQSPPPLVPGN